MDAKARRRLVGRRIRKARKAMGLSQRELARRMKLADQHQVSDWERGIHEPNAGNLSQLQQTLGQPLPFFFTEEDDDDEAVA